MSRKRRDEDERDDAGLGKLVSEHAPVSWWILFAIGVLLAAIAVPFCVHAAPTNNPALIIPAFLLGFASLFCLFVGGFGWLYTGGDRLALYKNGVIANTRAGSQECAWDDVESVTYGRPGAVYSDSAVTIHPYDGDPILISPELYGTDKVYRALVKGTIERLLRRANKELDRGDELDFGNGLTLGSDRVRYEKKKLPISDIDEVMIGRQVTGPRSVTPTFYLKSGGRTMMVPLLGMTNIHVLTQLFVHRFGKRVYIDRNVVEPLEGELDGAKHGR